MVFNVTRSDSSVEPAKCHTNFFSIIDQCIVNEEYWGGSFIAAGGALTYAIYNEAYPSNGLNIETMSGTMATSAKSGTRSGSATKPATSDAVATTGATLTGTIVGATLTGTNTDAQTGTMSGALSMQTIQSGSISGGGQGGSNTVSTNTADVTQNTNLEYTNTAATNTATSEGSGASYNPTGTATNGPVPTDTQQTGSGQHSKTTRQHVETSSVQQGEPSKTTREYVRATTQQGGGGHETSQAPNPTGPAAGTCDIDSDCEDKHCPTGKAGRCVSGACECVTILAS